MPSQVFEIRELVELICETVLTYRLDAEHGHTGLALYSWYLGVLRALATVNKFIGNIASTILWRELTNGLNPLLKVFPDDYVFAMGTRRRSGIIEKKLELAPTVGDFERFIKHSESVRYLRIDNQSPALFTSTYHTLFPMRPCFPQLRSLICAIPLDHALHLLHPGVTSLQIDRPYDEDGWSPQKAERIGHELRDRTPNLVRFRDMVPMPNRGRFSGTHVPAGTTFQASIDRILHEWTQLRHLEVSRFLQDFPELFKAISPLPNLEYLKIAIARDDIFEAPILVGVECIEDALHTASKLELEGQIDDLHIALALCSSGTRLNRISLLFYMNGEEGKGTAHEYFILPLTMSLIPIVELAIDIQDNGEDNQNDTPDWQLPSSAFSTLTTPKCDLVKVDIRIPYCVATTQSFLDQVTKSSSSLEHFVILRCTYKDNEAFYVPIITLGDMINFTMSLPKLQHLGLEIDSRNISHLDDVDDYPQVSGSTKALRSSHLKTLEVGASPIDDFALVAKHLEYYFPLLTNMGWEGGEINVGEIDEESVTDNFGSQWERVNSILGYVCI